jgi:hypothetical protein
MHRPQLQKTLASSESPRQNQQLLRSFCTKRSKAHESNKERPLRETTLSSKFVQVNECILCLKKVKFREFPIIMNKALQRKYYVFAETFQLKGIDKILNSPHSTESIRFADLKIWVHDEQFFKRFYLAQEFGQKFKNLWKFHQFSFNEPRFHLRKGQSICEKYYRQHRKLQERGIRKMLDLLSDSELENAQIDLNHFIAIKEEIIEHKVIKAEKRVLEDLRFSIEEQNYSAKLPKAFEKSKIWHRTSPVRKQGPLAESLGLNRESCKKSENNKVRLKETVKDAIMQNEWEHRRTKGQRTDSFDRLVEHSGHQSEIFELSMADQSYSLFEFTKAQNLIDSDNNHFSQPSDSKRREFSNLNSEFDIQKEVVDTECRDLFSRFGKVVKEERTPKPKPIPKTNEKTTNPRIDSDQNPQNHRKIKYKDEVGTFFKKMAHVPSREFIKSTVFHSAKEILIPENTLTSKTFKGSKQLPLFSEIAKHAVSSAKHLVTNLPSCSNLPKETQTRSKLQPKNENLRIVNFYKKTTEVMQSINDHNELIKISDCLPSKESNLHLNTSASKSDFRNVKKIMGTPSINKAKATKVSYPTKTDRTETQFSGSTFVKMAKGKVLPANNVKSYEQFSRCEKQVKQKEGPIYVRKDGPSAPKQKPQDKSGFKRPSMSPSHSKELAWTRKTADSKFSNYCDHLEQITSRQDAKSKSKAQVFPLKAFGHLLAKHETQDKSRIIRNSSFKVPPHNTRKVTKEKLTFGHHINNPSLNNFDLKEDKSQPQQTLSNRNHSLLNFKNLPTSNTSRGQPTSTKNPGRILQMFSLTAKSSGSLKDRPHESKVKLKPAKTPALKNVPGKFRRRDSIRGNKLSVELPIDDKTSCDPVPKSVSPNIYDHKTFYRTTEPLADYSSKSTNKRIKDAARHIPNPTEADKLPIFYQTKYKLQASPLAKNLSAKKFFMVPKVISNHSFSPDQRKNARQKHFPDERIDQIWSDSNSGAVPHRPTLHKTASLYSKKHARPPSVVNRDLAN